MDDFNDNQDIARNRKGGLDELRTSEETNDEVTASLTDQIPKGLKNVLDKRDLGLEIVKRWDQGNMFRAEQLERQRILMVEVDEFMKPIYRKAQEWQSDLHIPMAFIICKTMHARMFAAVMGQDPAFQVKAQKEANTDRVSVVQDLMNYSIKRWANNNEGIDDIVDDWLWAWITSGRGIIKQRWVKQFSRLVDVEKRFTEGPSTIVNGQLQPTLQTEEIAVKKDLKIFEGPIFEHVNDEDILIIGGNGNPDKADFVCQQMPMTANELWSLVDQKIFDKDVVEEILSDSSPDENSEEPVNQTKNDKSDRAGEGGSSDDQELIDRYQILEAYLKVDLDDSGVGSDLIVWVHAKTGKICRATYLWRVNRTGLKPFSVIDFHRRKGQQSAVGLIELIYPLSKELDAMHNMKIDFGVISTMPFGFYRASSSLSKERIPLTPGNLIPLDDPIRDINFPNLGNRSAFAAGEEQALFGIISRVTGLSDLNFGSLQSQGATRTATGVTTIVNESNANLDIFLRRANRGFKKMLIYLFHNLKDRLPDGFEFRITGSDGNDYFRTISSREELKGMYDFEIEPNSANSNKQIQLNTATQIFQITQNPVLLQTGIVTIANLFEAAKNLLQTFGARDWSRFITSPPEGTRIFTPEEIANRIIAGIDVILTPDQDLAGFVAFAQDFIGKDDLLGQLTEQQTISLVSKMQEAQQLMQALQQAAAQQANAQQITTNTNLATQPVGQPVPIGDPNAQ